MRNKGIDFLTYITEFADDAIKEAENMMTLNKEDTDVYCGLLEQFKEINGSKKSADEKGKILEETVSFILSKSAVFDVYENVRTSSNEIDLLTRLNKKGDFFQKQGLLSFDSSFLCECKNYSRKIDVTWVGKFYSLVKVSKNTLGILFSYHGFSGSGWNYANGLTKKIFLSDENNTRIIDFNIDDFNKIADGYSFFQIINDKIFNLENDTNISHQINEHPNKEILQKTL